MLPHWTHPNLTKGTVIPVVCYSNCTEVELFLNGKSLGRKKESDLHEFAWNVPYEPGTLTAKGFNNNVASASFTATTASNPSQLSLTASNQQLKAGREDISILTFKVTDSKGVMVPWANDPVHFHIDGPVHLKSFENGDPIDVTANQSRTRKVFYGMARGFFLATPGREDITITAASILGDSLFQDQTKIAIDVQRIALRGKLQPVRLEIYYTLDGTTPSAKKNKYGRPFTIHDNTKVRAIVLINGKVFMNMERMFLKGNEKTFFEPRYVVSDGKGKEVKPFGGPFDSKAAGDWKDTNDNTTYNFTPKGEVFKLIDDRKKLVGYWWYSFARDVFENPDDTGAGGIAWINSNTVYNLSLTDKKFNKMVLKKDGKEMLVLEK
jgi:beta-galactosidase